MRKQMLFMFCLAMLAMPIFGQEFGNSGLPTMTLIDPETGEETVIAAKPMNEIPVDFDDVNAPVEEQTGSWGDSMAGPTLYQTGWYYWGGIYYPLSSAYGASVTYISGSFNTSPYRQDVVAYLLYVNPSTGQAEGGFLVGQYFYGSVTNGPPSTYQWRYVFFVDDPTPELIQPPVNITNSTLNVTWAN